MRIAVLSSYAFVQGVNNYGSILQYYALQSYLESLGEKVYWIRFNPIKRESSRIKMWLKKKILKSNYKLDNKRFHNKDGFIEFTAKHLYTSDKIYLSYKELKDNPPVADLYIVGSDQIWNGWSPERYLRFVPENMPCISYAVSFGHPNIPFVFRPLLWFYLRKFKAVSVREFSGINICMNCGRKDVHYVVDPTFLLDRNKYIELINDNIESRIDGKYLYGYFVNPFPDNKFPFDTEVRSFAKERELEIFITAIQNAEKAFQDYNILQPSPFEWIGNLLHADYIITNSFHGVAFCIILRKQFILLPQIGMMKNQECRYFDLLKKFQLEDRIYKEDKGTLANQLVLPIDWDSKEETINNFILESKEWLQNVIKK